VLAHLFRKKQQVSLDDEDSLVAFAQKGDKDAYRELVERYQKKAFAVAFEITRLREDAEDVVQEAFVKAFLALPHFKGESSFYTWFRRIVYNLAIDLRRHRTRMVEDIEYEDDIITINSAPFPSPNEALSRKEEAKRINNVLDALSPEHRAVIMLRDVEGLSYDEIAQNLNIQRGTVMSRLFYARKYMQKALKDLEFDVNLNQDSQVSKIGEKFSVLIVAIFLLVS